MKLLLSALLLALGIGFALPATNAYAYWCGPDRWCGPGPRAGVYVAPGVGFWWGRTWYPHPWHPGWDANWRADPGRNWCDWHRCWRAARSVTVAPVVSQFEIAPLPPHPWRRHRAVYVLPCLAQSGRPPWPPRAGINYSVTPRTM